eukprot:scaffold4619_cov222-Isochrysis_galbana.AAC.3
MENQGLRRASRCGARGMRLLSMAASPASPQTRAGASAAADRMGERRRCSSSARLISEHGSGWPRGWRPAEAAAGPPALARSWAPSGSR